MNIKNDPFLIIGGTTKAGTTSLYRYLGDHPEICKSSMKETRFFLDEDYPLDSKYRLKDGVEKYANYYNEYKSGQVKIEATPDYLYSKNTPSNIKLNLPNARMLFILREPISRLISWYNFSKQIGKLPDDIKLEDYVDTLKNSTKNAQHLMALEQGKYSTYLKSYYNVFEKEDIYIAFYEDLSTDIRKLMKKICIYLNIDPLFYDNYDFQQFNKTLGVKNQAIHKAYIQQSFRIRKMVHDKKNIHQLLKTIKQLIHPIYSKFNSKKVDKIAMNDSLKQELTSYYEEEYKYFNRIGEVVPWNS